MAKFKIPMTWEVFAEIQVTADSLEDAIKYVRENRDDIPLPDNAEYVDGSFDITGDDEFVKEYNKDIIYPKF